MICNYIIIAGAFQCRLRATLLVRDIENSYLQLEAPNDSAMNDLLGYSITYRIAVGPQAGRKAFTLQTVPAREEGSDNT